MARHNSNIRLSDGLVHFAVKPRGGAGLKVFGVCKMFAQIVYNGGAGELEGQEESEGVADDVSCLECIATWG